jgi:hypothetical protein
MPVYVAPPSQRPVHQFRQESSIAPGKRKLLEGVIQKDIGVSISRVHFEKDLDGQFPRPLSRTGFRGSHLVES